MPREPRPPRYRFKVGEIVRCIHASQQQLRLGGLYQIKVSIQTPRHQGFDQLVGLNIWPGMLWGAWRFKRLHPDD